MFSKEQLSVGDWFLFWFLMAIPLVNVVMFLVILFSSYSNATLKNMLLAQVLMVVIVVVVIIFILGSFSHFFDLFKSYIWLSIASVYVKIDLKRIALPPLTS